MCIKKLDQETSKSQQTWDQAKKQLGEEVERINKAGGQLELQVHKLGQTLDSVKGDMEALLAKVTNLEAQHQNHFDQLTSLTEQLASNAKTLE